MLLLSVLALVVAGCGDDDGVANTAAPDRAEGWATCESAEAERRGWPLHPRSVKRSPGRRRNVSPLPGRSRSGTRAPATGSRMPSNSQRSMRT